MEIYSFHLGINMHASLDSITAFVLVAERRGFTAAAERLGVSTSVVSKRVRALESHLDTALFKRTTRRVELTDAGRVFYARVGSLPARIAEAEEQVRDLSGEPRGELRVVIPTYFASPALYEQLVPAYLGVSGSVRQALGLNRSRAVSGAKRTSRVSTSRAGIRNKPSSVVAVAVVDAVSAAAVR